MKVEGHGRHRRLVVEFSLSEARDLGEALMYEKDRGYRELGREMFTIADRALEPEAYEQPCRHCRGTGGGNEPYLSCPVCEGTGVNAKTTETTESL